MTFETIDYQIERGRARITLNRPERRNALSLQLQQELHEALWDADNDTAVHSVILRGAGKDFCAGYDLKSAAPKNADGRKLRGARKIDDDIWQLERAQRLRMAIFDMHKPVIAAVHGRCLAGGTDLVFLCDMVIAAEDAVIAFPPARDFGSLPNQMWLYHCGPQWAKRLLLTGDSISGKDAQTIGLVMKAVPMADLEAEVEGLADRLALIDPDLLATQKRIVNLGLELMGARTLQRLACENDARGHNAAAAQQLINSLGTTDLKEVFRRRDEKFGDSRVRVHGPERRDADGRLVD